MCFYEEYMYMSFILSPNLRTETDKFVRKLKLFFFNKFSLSLSLSCRYIFFLNPFHFLSRILINISKNIFNGLL